MSATSIYALLVGIDKYLPPVPALDGCVNDMRAIRDFLKKRATESGTPLLMEILENEQATRQNIVSKFENHLTKATANDVVFFYYSGHGSQEKAHEIFWALEEDKKNETIVCYDSRMPDGMDLADKELATLLGVVAEKTENIIVIMDCCNSGSGTRATDTKIRNVDQLQEKVRALDSYILPRNMNSDRSVLSVSGTQQLVIPDARHVAMSAAQSFQLAKETLLGGSPRGVFTFSLIEVLETAVGPMTYADLMRRVRGLVTQRTYDQVPQLYARDSGDLDRVFLNGTATRGSSYFSVTHDRQSGWVIDAGNIHGIPDESLGLAPTIISVFAEDATEAELRDMSKALGKATITEVRPNLSLLRPDDSLFLDNKTAYRARIFSMPIKSLGVNVRGDVAQGVVLAKNALANDPEASVYVKAVDKAGDAAYNLIAGSKDFPDQYYITRKSDPDSQPLAEQIVGINAANAEKAVDQVFHVAKWERLLELRNPNSSIPSEGVKVDIYHATENRVVAAEKGGIIFRYKKADGKKPSFRVKITNNSGRRLYCGLLYMSSQYGVNPDALPQAGVWLDSGAEVWAVRGQAISGEVADVLYRLGKKSVRETFKLISSTKEFDARLMAMQELGLPRDRTRSTTNTRALSFGDAGGGDSGDDWNTTETAVTLERID